MDHTFTLKPADTGAAENSGALCRVMVIDSSATTRGLITRVLENDPAIKVVASAGEGTQAIRLAEKQPLDVVVLDVESSTMDGMDTIPQLLKAAPGIQIIMASSLTAADAEMSLKALELGAADCIAKPVSSRELMDADDFKRDLVAKVKALAGIRDSSGIAGIARAIISGQPAAMAPAGRSYTLRRDPIAAPEAIAIGSSTGGPQALFEILKNLGGIRQPVFITQHMPATFTTILAQHISQQCGVPCREAREGEIIEAGKVYLAPGDRHLTLKRFGQDVRVTLTQDPPENFCRPAVDPMLRSLASVYGSGLLVAILTGMGTDGLHGAEQVVRVGGSIIAQDEMTSAVWGMPGAVAMAGLCSAVLSVDKIGSFLSEQAQQPKKPDQTR